MHDPHRQRVLRKIVAIAAMLAATPAVSATSNVIQVLPDGVTPTGTFSNPLVVFQSPSVPNIANTVTASSGNVAAALAQAVIPGVGGKTTYITGLEITGAGAGVASVIVATVAGTTNQMNYEIVVPAGAMTSINPLIVQFTTPIAGAAVGGGITVSAPSFGVGNTNAAVEAHGFYQ